MDYVGQQLGNYRILRLLGTGGFAEVYLGEHIRLNTEAAIKVLHTQLTDKEMEDFLNEARTIARLDHPNIVRVMEFDVQAGNPFLVMTYAVNNTLRQRHPRGQRLSLATIVPYVKQVADALQYAHESKLIHRDVKPENMLVGRRNEILLSDFGIATVARTSRSGTGQDMAGTAAYMAPEQIQGHPRYASDQYSLGIVVYEWLTGDRPFHGSFIETCSQHLYAYPPPLRAKMAEAPPEVEQVVLKALEKDSYQRFPSIQAFAAALDQASKSSQTVATALSPDLPRLWKAGPAQRHILRQLWLSFSGNSWRSPADIPGLQRWTHPADCISIWRANTRTGGQLASPEHGRRHWSRWSRRHHAPAIPAPRAETARQENYADSQCTSFGSADRRGDCRISLHKHAPAPAAC